MKLLNDLYIVITAAALTVLGIFYLTGHTATYCFPNVGCVIAFLNN